MIKNMTFPIPDKYYQLFYRVAQAGMIAFAFVFRPATKGVNLAVWREGEILIIKNSYYHKHTLPGGYVKPGEAPGPAAVRELEEEVGLHVSPGRLKRFRAYRFKSHYKRETVTLFELHLKTAPTIRVDNREVIWAGFLSPTEALSLNLAMPVRRYLENKTGFEGE